MKTYSLFPAITAVTILVQGCFPSSPIEKIEKNELSHSASIGQFFNLSYTLIKSGVGTGDLGVGYAVPGVNDALWMIGTQASQPVRLAPPNNWVNTAPGAGTRVDIWLRPDGKNEGWVVNSQGQVWTTAAGDPTWQLRSSTPVIKDIGVGSGGVVWAVGGSYVAASGGYQLYRWSGTSWNEFSTGRGVKVSVAGDGNPYVVNTLGDLWFYNVSSNTWTVKNSGPNEPRVKDLAVGNNYNGKQTVFVLDNYAIPGGTSLWRLRGDVWEGCSGGGVQIDYDGYNGSLYLVTSTANLFATYYIW